MEFYLNNKLKNKTKKKEGREGKRMQEASKIAAFFKNYSFQNIIYHTPQANAVKVKSQKTLRRRLCP